MDKLMRLVVAMQLRLMGAVDEKDKGATATEYALLVAFIALAIVAGVTAFSGALSGWFSDLGTTITGWAS